MTYAMFLVSCQNDGEILNRLVDVELDNTELEHDGYSFSIDSVLFQYCQNLSNNYYFQTPMQSASIELLRNVRARAPDSFPTLLDKPGFWRSRMSNQHWNPYVWFTNNVKAELVRDYYYSKKSRLLSSINKISTNSKIAANCACLLKRQLDFSLYLESLGRDSADLLFSLDKEELLKQAFRRYEPFSDVIIKHDDYNMLSYYMEHEMKWWNRRSSKVREAVREVVKDFSDSLCDYYDDG